MPAIRYYGNAQDWRSARRPMRTYLISTPHLISWVVRLCFT
jgi:hypothetical protein